MFPFKKALKTGEKSNLTIIQKIIQTGKQIYDGYSYESIIYNKVITTIKVFIVATRKFLLDDCLTEASAIAYTTIVSLIPMLTVVLTFISVFSGAENKKEDLFRSISLFMTEHSIKLNIDFIFEAISGLIDNAKTIGGIGAILMVVSATATIRALEKSLNKIWSVKLQRTLYQKTIYYWARAYTGTGNIHRRNNSRHQAFRYLLGGKLQLRLSFRGQNLGSRKQRLTSEYKHEYNKIYNVRRSQLRL